MSCETNFHTFCESITGAGSDVATAFGGDPQQAQAALVQIFQTARNQTPTTGDPNIQGKLQALQAQSRKHQATEATTRLFDEMRGKQITPPTHSATGLPKPDARRGYAAVYQTLQAIRERKPLPALAQQIRTQQQLNRTIRGVGTDSHGLRRCSGCGRFASERSAHICPHTASAQDLNRTLMRRLRVPATAYGEAELQALIAAAQQGLVSMTHGLSGEAVEVTLDALPLALGMEVCTRRMADPTNARARPDCRWTGCPCFAEHRPPGHHRPVRLDHAASRRLWPGAQPRSTGCERWQSAGSDTASGAAQRADEGQAWDDL